ncbi:hypothetical protein ACIQAC_18270 [Streptomyces sp. NPDC088387]|uniref:hypothetical protein n=1 Tax=Streptomyces sp. NPDC088387 TaxID=3365859 RepID=UPI003830747E
MRRRARTRRQGTGIALAVLLTLAGAACGGSDDSGTDDAARDDSTPGSAAPSAHSPSPTPTPTPTVTAADGRDVTACSDAECEVLVSRPVTVRFEGPGGAATLAVTKVGPNEVEYTVKSSNGQSKGGASGPGQGCLTVLRTNGSGNSCGGVAGAPPSPEPDTVLIQLAGGADGTAILHMRTG